MEILLNCIQNDPFNFFQDEFEAERSELNEVVQNSKQLLQVTWLTNILTLDLS